MSGSPRIVTEDVRFQWDGVTQRLGRGQVIDVTPGSPLEAAIGKHRLDPVGPVASPPPVEAAEPAEKAEKEDAPGEEAASVQPRATPKQDDSKDGGS